MSLHQFTVPPSLPPDVPSMVSYEVCPTHGWNVSGPIGCHCEAYDGDDCVCENAGKTWCAECKTVVQDPAVIRFRIASSEAPS